MHKHCTFLSFELLKNSGLATYSKLHTHYPDLFLMLDLLSVFLHFRQFQCLLSMCCNKIYRIAKIFIMRNFRQSHHLLEMAKISSTITQRIWQSLPHTKVCVQLHVHVWKLSQYDVMATHEIHWAPLQLWLPSRVLLGQTPPISSLLQVWQHWYYHSHHRLDLQYQKMAITHIHVHA